MASAVWDRTGKFALHGCIASFGTFAAIWGLLMVPTFRAAYDTSRIAVHLVAGDAYPTSVLREKTEAPNAPDALPRFLRDKIILRLNLIEAEEKAGTGKPEDYELLEAMTLQALSQQPGDSYLWLILFWLRALKSGPSIESLSALRMSYLYGPHEGWVAVARNRFSLQYFAALPEDMQDRVIQEFKLLVASGYASQSADILTGQGWPIHDRLLAAIEDVPELPKQQFALHLQVRNDAIRVPGVVYPSNR